MLVNDQEDWDERVSAAMVLELVLNTAAIALVFGTSFNSTCTEPMASNGANMLDTVEQNMIHCLIRTNFSVLMF